MYGMVGKMINKPNVAINYNKDVIVLLYSSSP